MMAWGPFAMLLLSCSKAFAITLLLKDSVLARQAQGLAIVPVRLNLPSN